MAAPTSTLTVGPLLKDWRSRRRMSQLELATVAEVSTRHLSFIETGRSRPSRELVLHLATQLEVPLREQNALLIAAGFSAAYGAASLDDPALEQVKAAVELVLGNHDPFPAVVINRHWDLVSANAGAMLFLEGCPPELMSDPINACRVTLHPEALGGRLLNLDEVGAHLVGRVQRQLGLTGDPVLEDLLAEITSYPGVPDGAVHTVSADEPLLTMRMTSAAGDVAFFTTVATFGTPHDVTLSELSVELFFPADADTRRIMQD